RWSPGAARGVRGCRRRGAAGARLTKTRVGFRFACARSPDDLEGFEAFTEGERSGAPRLAVHGRVSGAIRLDFDDVEPWISDALHGRAKRRPVRRQGVTTAIHAHCEREIDVRWSAEPIFEDIGLGSLGKIVKDAAAVVVDEHYREVQPVASGCPKAVQVVVE